MEPRSGPTAQRPWSLDGHPRPPRHTCRQACPQGRCVNPSLGRQSRFQRKDQQDLGTSARRPRLRGAGALGRTGRLSRHVSVPAGTEAVHF